MGVVGTDKVLVFTTDSYIYVQVDGNIYAICRGNEKHTMPNTGVFVKHDFNDVYDTTGILIEPLL